MKIMMISDREESALWDHWSESTAERLRDVELILSAGDLKASYLEFLVTMLNVPLVYVPGNHDGAYENSPPQGCINADGRIVHVICDETPGGINILGFGGSMRYNDESRHMYTEREMKKRIKRLRLSAFDSTLSSRKRNKRDIDILLTHAPCRGYGDMDDLPHRGFECFNELIHKERPKLHVYGHVHKEYGQSPREGEASKKSGGYVRIINHPSGAILINANGSYLYDLKFGDEDKE